MADGDGCRLKYCSFGQADVVGGADVIGLVDVVGDGGWRIWLDVVGLQLPQMNNNIKILVKYINLRYEHTYLPPKPLCRVVADSGK
jgi:hypothetical protein